MAATVVVEAAGDARGDPGPAGYGAVVVEPVTGVVRVERSGALGVMTREAAAYHGLIAGLRAAHELGAAGVEVRMSAELVVEQMAGRQQIRDHRLRSLAAEAAQLVSRFGSVSWVLDHENRSDALARGATPPVAPSPSPSPSPSPPTVAPAASGAVAPPAPGAVAAPAWAPPSAAPLRMLLVRHGETPFTAQRRYSGRGDVQLSPFGRAQAEAVAARVAGLAAAPAAVVTSPLSRCTATANTIAAACGNPPVVVDDALIECDFGAWEGLTFAEVRERYPTELDDWLSSPAVAPPGGESFHAVADRVSVAVDRLRREYAGHVIAVVSHVTPIKLVLRDALDAGDSFLYRLYLDAGGLSIVDSWPDGGVAVRAVNETAFLPVSGA